MGLIKKILGRLSKLRGQTYLGVDLGSYALKVAEISVEGDQPILKGFTQARTFENTLVNHMVNDPALLISNLKNLFSNLNPPPSPIFLSLPYELTIFGKFSITDPQAITEIEKQINDEIPYKLEDVYYSYFIMPEKEKFDLYYLVTKRDNLEKLKQVFLDLGFSLENVDADFINMHNFLEYLYGPENKAVIDLGEAKIKIHFANKEVPFYTRELFNLGFKNLKAQIMKEFKITADRAERDLHLPPSNSKGNKIKEMYVEYIKTLVNEINFGIEITRSKYNFSPEVIYLIGGGAKIPGIHSLLRELIGIEVREIDVRERIRIDKNIEPSYLKTITTQGALALASAIKEFI